MDNNNPLISAIDNHNVANGDGSWFDAKLDSTTGLVEDVADAVTKGSVGVVVAGVNSILNSGIAVANFVGADIEQISTYETLKSLDDDLGQYYRKHEEGIEIGGLLAGSFIPGLAGVKAIQAAKAGFLGTNMAKSSGLITSLTRDYAKAAKIEFASGNSPFTVLNGNVIKSLAQGFGSQALEATAFEIAVAGTMFKSPTLEHQTANDLMWNIATGTLIGGGVGGLLHGVGTIYGVKKAGVKIDTELFPYRNITELNELASPDLKIINYFQQKLNLPEAGLLEDFGPIRPGQASELDPATRLNLIVKERAKTNDRMEILIRQEFIKYCWWG
jgi:hypothetical protein